MGHMFRRPKTHPLVALALGCFSAVVALEAGASAEQGEEAGPNAAPTTMGDAGGARGAGIDAGPCPADMVPIPGASVRLGSKTDPLNPPHVATLRAFCIDRLEVTWGAYRGAIGAPRPSPGSRWDGPFPVAIGFDAASAHCRGRGRRLPTPDEWEYAATGGTERIFPWGDQPSPRGPRRGEPVGTNPRDVSPFGVADMGENVAEWTESGSQCADDASASRFMASRGSPGMRLQQVVCRPAVSVSPGFRCAR